VCVGVLGLLFRRPTLVFIGRIPSIETMFGGFFSGIGGIAIGIGFKGPKKGRYVGSGVEILFASNLSQNRLLGFLSEQA
jgi:hypothetical protein